MANRVTAAEVEQIMDLESSITDTEINVFIGAANLVVTDNLGDQDLDDDLLKEIERWLSAHLLTARDPQVKSDKTGEAQVTYEGAFGKGLDSSRYGQIVKILDSTGILANSGKRTAEVKVIDAITGQ